MSIKHKILIILIVSPLFILFSIISHEVGHALTAKMLGADAVIYVWPGYEIYPNIGSIYENDWPDGVIAFVENKYEVLSTGKYISPPIVPLDVKKTIVWGDIPVEETTKPIFVFVQSIISLMGSGFNLLLSLLSLLSIYIFKPKGVWLAIASMGALLHYDILLYSVLPTIFNLRHLFLWGGNAAEPIIALSQFGLSQYFSISIVIVLSTLQFVCLYKLIMNRNGSDAEI